MGSDLVFNRKGLANQYVHNTDKAIHLVK